MADERMSMDADAEFDQEMSDAVRQMDEMEAQDTVTDLGFTKELIDEIREKKATNPGMFVSAWQDDDVNIAEKDLTDKVEKFLTAAEEGRLDEVQTMLADDPSLVTATDADQYTALHRASYSDHVDVMQFLLNNGADPLARTMDGWTPLHSASNWANYDAIAVLLSRGVDANAVSNGKVTPLHLAINSQTDDPERVFHSVRYLLQAPGIDLGIASGSGDTAVMLARRTSQRVYEMIADHLDR